MVLEMIHKKHHQLKNTHNLTSIISQIYFIEHGETVGYNRAFVAKKPSKSATIPIGHADGISRRLGNGKGHVLINNQKAYIIGNVCMDMIMVNVTNLQLEEGERVEIIGEHQDRFSISNSNTDVEHQKFLLAVKKMLKY